jgi:hypothetical protein
MDPVDVLTASRTKTQVMKAGSILIEASFILARRRPTDQNPGTAPDAVNDLVGANQGLHAKEVTEFLPKGNAPGWVVDRHLDMGDSVDFDAHENLFLWAPASHGRVAKPGANPQGI